MASDGECGSLFTNGRITDRTTRQSWSYGSLFQNPTQPKISGPNPTHKSLHPTQPNPSSTLGMAY